MKNQIKLLRLRRLTKKRVADAGGVFVRVRGMHSIPEYLALFPYHTYNFVHLSYSDLPVEEQAAHYAKVNRMKYRVYVINSKETLEAYIVLVTAAIKNKEEKEKQKALRSI